MSTEYHLPVEPVDKITVTEDGDMVCATLITKDGALGTFRTSKENLPFFLCHMKDDHVVIHTTFGGESAGLVVSEHTRGLDPEQTVISEYGELFTVSQIRALSGAGKS